MTDWVSSGGVKIERAKQHIADLEGQTKAFFQVAPYTLIGEYEPKSRDTVYRWRPVPAAREIPPIWGAIAGDVIHNLRSSSMFSGAAPRSRERERLTAERAPTSPFRMPPKNWKPVLQEYMSQRSRRRSRS